MIHKLSARLAVTAAVSLSIASAGDWSLHLLNLTQYPLAQCLDGSPGGFWFYPGAGANASKFLVMTEGGAWCVSDADCYARSTTFLGSSSQWGNASANPGSPLAGWDGGNHGMFSNDTAINPLFYGHSKVFIQYCDGGSYAGGVLAPVPYTPPGSSSVNSVNLYYRGRYITDAIYSTLMDAAQPFGMAAAQSLLVKGSSAGGLAVYVLIEHIASLVRSTLAAQGRDPASMDIRAAPGCGFFLSDFPSINGSPAYLSAFQTVYAMQNISAVVPATCLAAYPAAADAWRCFCAPYLLPFITVPMFISNSLVDSWQQGAIMQLGCDPTKAGACNAAQLAYLRYFHSGMVAAAAPVLNDPRHGAFLQSCSVHDVENIDGSWNGVVVANQTQVATFTAWLLGSLSSNPAAAGASPVAVDCMWTDGGCNPTCSKY